MGKELDILASDRVKGGCSQGHDEQSPNRSLDAIVKQGTEPGSGENGLLKGK